LYLFEEFLLTIQHFVNTHEQYRLLLNYSIEFFFINQNFSGIELQKNIVFMMPTPKPPTIDTSAAVASGMSPKSVVKTIENTLNPQVFRCNEMLGSFHDIAKNGFKKCASGIDALISFTHCRVPGSLLYKFSSVGGTTVRESAETLLACPNIPTKDTFSYITEESTGRTYTIDHCRNEIYYGARQGVDLITIKEGQISLDLLKPRGPEHPLGPSTKTIYQINHHDFASSDRLSPPSTPSLFSPIITKSSPLDPGFSSPIVKEKDIKE
jgi:hypothetical protein